MTEFLIHTGSIIKEYLDARNITQRDLANRIGISEKHISNLLNGKSRLTEEMALNLEKVMPDIPARYWMDYESKYREYLARKREFSAMEKLDLKSLAKRFHFNEVFYGTGLSQPEMAERTLRLLGLSNFEQFSSVYGNLAVDYMEDGGEPEAMAVWLKLCEAEIDVQNNWLGNTSYIKSTLEGVLPEIKDIALNTSIEASLADCREVLNECGIYLAERDAISNCKVRGALITHFGNPAILLSHRFKSHDHVWFALMHEIGHLLLHYDGKTDIVSLDEDYPNASETKREVEANEFARNFFVDPAEYEKFIAASDFSPMAILQAAPEFGVDAGVLAGFLLHDGYESHEKLSHLRTWR